VAPALTWRGAALRTTSTPDPRAHRASTRRDGETRPLGTRCACTSSPPGPGSCAFRSARIAGARRPPSVTVAAAAVPPGPWDLGAWSRGRDRAGAPHRSALRGRGGTVGNACHGLIGLGLRKWMHDWMGAGRAVQLATLAFLKKKKKKKN